MKGHYEYLASRIGLERVLEWAFSIKIRGFRGVCYSLDSCFGFRRSKGVCYPKGPKDPIIRYLGLE